MKKMCRYTFLAVALILAAFGMAAASGAVGNAAKIDQSKPPSEAVKTVEKMKFKPLKYNIPKVGREVERVVLPNGMILYLREDHRYPEVSISGIIRTGSAYEKKNRYGVAGLTGTVMRTGGTKDYTPEKLNEELEFMAATLETSIGVESGGIYLTVISPQLDKGLDLFAQVLRYPRFDKDELELAKSQIKAGLKRRNERASNIGRLEFYGRVYSDYSYGWEYEWDVIKNIDRKDLIAWHKRFYRPNNMMFAVVGDFKKEEIIKAFNKRFGDWPKGKVDFTGLQEVKMKFIPGIFYAEKKQDQSYIRLGHLGVKRTNPDVYALKVMDFILGSGGFRSMLMEKVRSDEGLAYSVGSYFNTTSRVHGTSGAYSSTRADATVKALELILSIIKKMRTEKVSKERLVEAKSSIVNSFLFEFKTPTQQTLKLMMLEYNDMPRDYYEKYTDRIKAVTVGEVLRVAKKYLQPDKLTIIIVGDKERFDKPLTSLGVPVKDIELKEFTE